MLKSDKEALHTALFDTEYDSEDQTVTRIFGLVAELLAEKQSYILVQKVGSLTLVNGPYWDKRELNQAKKYLELAPVVQHLEVQCFPAKFWVEPDTLPAAECEECGHIKDGHCPSGSVPAESKATKRTQPAGCLQCLRDGGLCDKVYPRKGQWDTKTPQRRR